MLLLHWPSLTAMYQTAPHTSGAGAIIETDVYMYVCEAAMSAM